MTNTIKKIVLNFLIICFFTTTSNILAFSAVNNFNYSAVSPRSNSTISEVRPDVEVAFSKIIEIYNQTLYDDITITDSKGNNISITKTITDTKLKIGLREDLSPNTKYTITIPGGALDYKSDPSCVNAPIATYFTTKNNSFNYYKCTPSNNATNVDINLQYVSLTFSENIIENADDKIYVKDSTDKIVSNAGKVTNNLLQFKITGTLSPYSTYTIEIPQGSLKYDASNDGLEINEEISIKFTTINDTEKPNYLTNQSSGVIDPGAPITIKFDKKIKLTQDKDKIKLTSGSNDLEVPVKATVSQSGYDLIITPSETLMAKQSYTLYVPNQAVTDFYMNTMYRDFNMKITTGVDLTSPTILSSSVTDGQTDVPIGTSEITVKFSEPIKYAATYNDIKLKDSDDKEVSIRKSFASDTLIVSLPTTKPLSSNTLYTLTVPNQSVQDYNGNTFDNDYILTFTTNDPGSITVNITTCAALDGLEVDAGTSYDDVLNYMLPNEVSVTLSDKSTEQVGVQWYQVAPAYKDRLVGLYTFTGKLLIRGNISNPKNVKATAKVKVVDRANPTWQSDASLNITEGTSNSVKLEWTEASDDTYIKEYSVEAIDETSKSKTTKITSDKITRLSDDKSNSNYDILYYTLTGLQPGTRYTIYLSATDSQGKTTAQPLEDTVQTDAKPTSSSKPQTTAKPKPTATPKQTSKPDSSSSESEYFNDLNGYDWAVSSIDALTKKGVIKGTSDVLFSPGDNITRADLTLLIVRAFNLDDTFNDNFNDVPKSAYYYDKIGIAKKLGIIKGNNTNNFYPDEYISREDMFVILKRAIDISGTTLDNNNINAKSFADYNTVSDYAKDAVDNLISAKVITGDNKKINPKNFATRAEVAVLLNKF